MSARIFMLMLVAVLAGACAKGGPAPAVPVITAQGFDISDPRVAEVSEFGDVRLRLEVSGKIDELWISEGSFGVDLAKTLEKDLFRLFGLDQRPYSRSDVTLNLRNYLNERITETGAYQIDVAVTDHLGQSASGTVFFNVQASGEEEDMSAPEIAQTWAETGDFVFRRVGRKDVSGADLFGISWKTIGPIKVTIRLASAVNGATKIARLHNTRFHEIHTREQIAEIVDSCIADDEIEFDTANAAAAGEVFAVVNEEERYLLQASASDTYLTEAGTTVILTGRYKH